MHRNEACPPLLENIGFSAGNRVRRNVEVKVRVKDLSPVAATARKIADVEPVVIRQEDCYYDCPEGLLKLRKAPGSEAELIHYERSDRETLRESRYRIQQVPDLDHAMSVLSERFKELGVVRKKRLLFMVGTTRIHLDEVDGLGSFVEIEAVLREGETLEQGEETVCRLMELLGIQNEDRIGNSYIDLIRRNI